jgi:hypothetical protein
MPAHFPFVTFSIYLHLEHGTDTARSRYRHKLTQGLKVLWLGRTDILLSSPITVESVPISSNWERLNFPQVTEEH